MINFQQLLNRIYLYFNHENPEDDDFEPNNTTSTPSTPPPGMYPTRKSTSVPDILRRMRTHKIHVPMSSSDELTCLEDHSPARVLVQSRCKLTTSARDKAVTVTVQYLRSQTSDYIKIFKNNKCILHLDRRLLKFCENADRLELALNSKSEEYDWWLLQFDRKHLRSYFSLHYHILTDASL